MTARNILRSLKCVAFVAAFLLAGCAGSEKSEKAVEPVQQETSPEADRTSLGFYLQGSLYDQQGDFAKAILEYQKALRFKQDAAIYFALSKDYALLGDVQEALTQGAAAIRLDPNNRTYHETLGQIYVNLQD